MLADVIEQIEDFCKTYALIPLFTVYTRAVIYESFPPAEICTYFEITIRLHEDEFQQFCDELDTWWKARFPSEYIYELGRL